MKAKTLANLLIALALSCTSFTAFSADEVASECGAQQSPEKTWESWRQAYVSGDWKKWFSCHNEDARAALFLSSALATPNSKEKTRVIDKYGRCEARPKPSLECITEETVADFFHEMTTLDETLARTRLSKIWKREGMRVDGAQLNAIVLHDRDHATGTIQSEQLNEKIEKWTMSFVRVDGRWFVTFKWGM